MIHRIKVLGGSVNPNQLWEVNGSSVVERTNSKLFAQDVTKNCISGFERLDIADEATGLKVLGAAGWATAGAVLAGPLGAVVGGILGGMGKSVTFIAKFSDGRTMMGQVPGKVWVHMLSKRV